MTIPLRIAALFAALLIVLTGCASPPQITVTVDAQKQSDDAVLLKLKVVNLENRVTVPIAIQLTAENETGGHWAKPETVLQPAAFVLNRKEQRTITKLWKVPADAIRTTLVLREQESGKLLKTEKAEKTFAAPTSQP